MSHPGIITEVACRLLAPLQHVTQGCLNVHLQVPAAADKIRQFWYLKAPALSKRVGLFRQTPTKIYLELQDVVSCVAR